MTIVTHDTFIFRHLIQQNKSLCLSIRARITGYQPCNASIKLCVKCLISYQHIETEVDCSFAIDAFCNEGRKQRNNGIIQTCDSFAFENLKGGICFAQKGNAIFNIRDVIAIALEE